MKNRHDLRSVRVISVAAMFWITGADVTLGQFAQNKRETIVIDSKSLPKDIDKGYRLFKGKCSECHGLDVSLKMRMVPSQWDSEVKRMQSMASSQFNDDQAAAILKFLSYDELHRKSELGPVAVNPSSDSAAAGRELYDAQSCAACRVEAAFSSS
jgi:mono/diheme cytochrome c family protein